MQKIVVRQPVPNSNLSSDDLSPLLTRIYQNRGICNNNEINHDLASLPSFEKLSGIKQAVDCLWQVLKEQKKFLILGDYDADGATSTALAVRALQAFGAKQVVYLVPNRFTYGYGLTPEIVQVAAGYKPDLIVTVDNGISSHAGVAVAKQLGIKVVVTDHHIAGASLPEADAIVNPNQPGDQFESKNLAGVGVVFYVMLALRKFLREQNWFAEQNIVEPNMAGLLDLVALGTVADIVKLDHNNRILVAQGLRRIRAGKCCAGIKALLKVAKRNEEQLTANDLGFAVGPRLNAAGRLDDMSLGIACLLADAEAAALQKAFELNNLNNERRVIEADMQQQAWRELSRLQLDKELPLGLCLYDANWHQGVVGILASRVKDRVHRPVIAFAKVDANELKGSARSVSGLHIRDVLDTIAAQNPDLISKFGGHAMAAGLTINLNGYQDFCDAFTKEVGKYLDQDDLAGRIYIDGELTAAELTLESAAMLRNAGPWGQGFPEPMFSGRFNIKDQRLVANKHLKLTLALDGSNQLIDAIAFNVDLDSWPNERCDNLNAVYRLDVNEYRGIKRLQLIVEHLDP
ncbi:MAG: single-stranded-DNA-specific exonuclease RecJ [Gammaproteobacteria bacterium]|nr:single-stranded-DNA-specific exonuclease RecJ [Gammaproteobacteria bacterium]